MNRTDVLADVIASVLADGCHARLRVNGRSMTPTICDGDALALAAPTVREGNIVLFRRGDRLIAHRIVEVVPAAAGTVTVVTRGDASTSCDPPIAADAILATVAGVERSGRTISVTGFRARTGHFCRAQVRRIRSIVGAVWRITFTSDGIRASLSHKEAPSHINCPPAACIETRK